MYRFLGQRNSDSPKSYSVATFYLKTFSVSFGWFVQVSLSLCNAHRGFLTSLSLKMLFRADETLSCIRTPSIDYVARYFLLHTCLELEMSFIFGLIYVSRAPIRIDTTHSQTFMRFLL